MSGVEDRAARHDDRIQCHVLAATSNVCADPRNRMQCDLRRRSGGSLFKKDGRYAFRNPRAGQNTESFPGPQHLAGAMSCSDFRDDAERKGRLPLQIIEVEAETIDCRIVEARKCYRRPDVRCGDAAERSAQRDDFLALDSAYVRQDKGASGCGIQQRHADQTIVSCTCGRDICACVHSAFPAAGERKGHRQWCPLPSSR